MNLLYKIIQITNRYRTSTLLYKLFNFYFCISIWYFSCWCIPPYVYYMYQLQHQNAICSSTDWCPSVHASPAKTTRLSPPPPKSLHSQFTRNNKIRPLVLYTNEQLLLLPWHQFYNTAADNNITTDMDRDIISCPSVGKSNYSLHRI